MAGIRRTHGLVALLHVGHDGQSEGCALPSPFDHPARLWRGTARHAEPLGALGGAAGGADVPRQCVGPALLGRPGRRQAGLPRRGARWRQPARAVREGARHLHRRRADRVARPAEPHEGQQPHALDREVRRDRRLGRAARHDRDLRQGLWRRGPARLGHERDEPARHGEPSQGEASAPVASGTAGGAPEAGPPTLWRRHDDRRRCRQGTAARRQGLRRPAGARALDHLGLLQGRRRRGAA